MQRIVVYTAFCVALVGCLLEPPRYGDTEFACAAPTDTCPSNYLCVEGVCRPEGFSSETPRLDAGPPPRVIDAGTSVADAQPPQADAEADAAPVPVVTAIVTGAEMHDTFLRIDLPDENYGGNRWLHADASPIEVTLTRFDLSAIPSTAVVESAELVLSITERLESGELVAYRMLEGWSESEATWNQRSAGTPWTTAGAGAGSHDPTPLLSFAPREVGRVSVQLPPTTVQPWISQPAQNHGLRWVSTSTEGAGAEFKSSDTSQDDLRPLLRVRYR